MHAALLLSGGVDSSVALVRLQERGARVTCFYLKVWLEEELAGLGDCPWQEDLEYARAVCEQRRVPLHVVSVQQDYLEHVLDYVVRELRAGNTPSPDLMCNRHVKFGVFAERFADGFDTVATGHYARVVRSAGGPRLRTAPDPVKDQTYFLAYVSAGQLARAAFRSGTRRRPASAARRTRTACRPGDGPTARASAFWAGSATATSCAGGWASGRDRSWSGRPAACSASIAATTSSRSASGRAWDWVTDPGTSCARIRRRTGSRSAARRPRTRLAPSR